MKTTLHYTYVVLALIAGIHQAAAQGTAFTYQGRLNSGANPANGSYDMAFTLFTTNVTGTAIAGPVTNTAVGVTNGLFTTLVNFTNGFVGGSNWLQVAVSTNAANSFGALLPRQQLTPVPYAIFAEGASNVLGTVPGSGLSGNYVNPITMNNPGNVLGGNGNLLTSLNASAFIQGTIPAFALSNAWKIVGNTNANPTNGVFVGTLDNFPLEFRVNNQRGLRLEYATNADQNVTTPNQSINVIGGSSANSVSSGVVAATIGGGGVGGIPSFPNQVSADYGTIGGGFGNTVSGHDASVVGGAGNTASGVGATVAGGEGNTASGALSFAAGLNAQATNNGSFVWSDLSSPVNNFYSTNNNSFNVRAAGGARFVTFGAGLNVDGPVAATAFQVGTTFIVEPRPANTGANNFFAGQSAGVANTSGIQNTFVGNNAGFGNTTGGGNSFYGYNVGSRTTIGNSETFMGNSAGFFNTVGDQNTFYGAGAGQSNTNGSFNTFVGTTAGLNNLSGSNNIALGYRAGINLTTGSSNIDIGNPGLASDSNTIRIGNGQSTIFLAGTVNGSGSGLTGVALLGSANTFTTDQTIQGQVIAAGSFAALTMQNRANSAQNWQWRADATGLNVFSPSLSQPVTISPSGNVGINSTAPTTEKLVVAGGADFTTAAANPNTDSGLGLSFESYGGRIQSFQNKPLVLNPAANNVCIGTTNQLGELTIGTGNGLLSIVGGPFTPELWSTGGGVPGHMRFRNALEVWPNTNTTAAGYIDVRGTNGTQNIVLDGSNGNITCVAVNITSDRNAKEDFTSLNPLDVLAKVAALPITEWQYKAEKAGDAAATRHIGPMAQDFHNAFTLGQDDKHISVVDEGGVALAAIQGLNQKLEEKDARIEQLEKTVSQLSDLVNKLAVQQNGGAK